jgi:hypothetical protein
MWETADAAFFSAELGQNGENVPGPTYINYLPIIL